MGKRVPWVSDFNVFFLLQSILNRLIYCLLKLRTVSFHSMLDNVVLKHGCIFSTTSAFTNPYLGSKVIKYFRSPFGYSGFFSRTYNHSQIRYPNMKHAISNPKKVKQLADLRGLTGSQLQSIFFDDCNANNGIICLLLIFRQRS